MLGAAQEGGSVPRLQAICILGLLLLPLGVAACGPVLGPSEPSPGSYAPTITDWFPEATTQVLLENGSLVFSASGEDLDSLDLSWEWRLDDSIQALGESVDGVFDESWTLSWEPGLAAGASEVCFEVSDGQLSAELFWPVDVD